MKIIKCKCLSNYSYVWEEYDEHGNCVHSKDSDGYEKRFEYDLNNNCIYWEDLDYYKEWNDYDEHGHIIIHCKNSDKYDNLIHWRDSKDKEWFRHDKI